MRYAFWKWVYDLSKRKMSPYNARKCEHCLRWDTEAPITVVKDTFTHQTTRCSGCGKHTKWFMGSMVPVWNSRFTNGKR